MSDKPDTSREAVEAIETLKETHSDAAEQETKFFMRGYAAGFDRGWPAGAEAMREAAASAARSATLPSRLVEGGPMAGWQTFTHEWPATIEAAIRALPLPERKP